MPIKGKQISDNSLDLKKVSGGINILPSDAKLGINKLVSEFTDPNEYITKAYVDDLSDDVDNDTIVVDGTVLKVNLKDPVASDEIGLSVDGTNGIFLAKSFVSATVLGGLGLDSTVDGDGIKTLDVKALSIVPGQEVKVRFGTAGDLVIDYDDFSDKLDKVDGTTQTVASDVNFNGIITFNNDALTIKNSQDFTNLNEFVSKGYVDSVAQGIDWKESVLIATDQDLITGWTYTIDPTGSSTSGYQDTLSFSSGIAGFHIDSGSTSGLVIGDRILVKDQTDQKQNGIYSLTSSTTLTRATDQDGSPSFEVSGGNAVFIESGTYVNDGYVLQGTGNLALNVDDLAWIQFSGAGQITAGAGLSKLGDTMDVELATNAGLEFDAIGVAGKLQINVDDATVELATNVLRVKANGINNTHIDYGTNGNQVYADSIPTEGYVWMGTANSGDSIQEILQSLDSDIAAADLTTASNGITETGNNIELGGTLTQNTTIDGDGGLYNFVVNDLNTLTLATSSGYSLSMNGTATFTDTGSSAGLSYFADYSANYTDRSLVDAGYVNSQIAKASTAGDTRWETVEITGFFGSGTSGLVSYLGSITFGNAIDDANVYVNGIRVQVPSEASFGTNGESVPSPGDTLYFNIPTLGYNIEDCDELMITYLTN